MIPVQWEFGLVTYGHISWETAAVTVLLASSDRHSFDDSNTRDRHFEFFTSTVDKTVFLLKLYGLYIYFMHLYQRGIPGTKDFGLPKSLCDRG